MYLYISTNISENIYVNVLVNKLHGRTNESYLKFVDCGPALKFPADESTTKVEIDHVKCIFCPQWPKEARHWPTRPRTFGWPTINTISEVVQNGCHIVYVQHRSCRNDKGQWRFSFSLAEVILLQGWTKTQQIVYHLLRFFAKRELFQKDCPKEDEVLSTYHLKTLMLWTCEEMSPEWWDYSPVIAICSEMLEILSKWLKRRFYPNYFIPEANLFHQPSRSAVLHQTQRRLNDFSISDILSHWFIENYILPITRTQLKFLNKGNVITHFMGYLLPLLEHRKTAVSDYLNDRFLSIMEGSNYCRRAIKFGCISGLRLQLQLKQFDGHLITGKVYLPIIEKNLCFTNYEILLYILHTVDGMRCGVLSWDSSLFVELVSTILVQSNIIRSQHHNFPKTYTEQSSRFHFLRAQNLMENLSGINSSAEFQLLSLMSKEFLRRTLECDDSQFNGIAPAALTYLAALHFATSEYPEAIHLCFLVLSDLTPHKDTEILNAGCLLFIDDIASIVGLCVLHKTITNNDIQYIGGRFSLDLRLSCGVFAHYLNVQSEDRISKPYTLNNDLPDSEVPVEQFLNALIKMKSGFTMKSGTHFNAVYRRTDYLAGPEATSSNRSIIKETVIDLLMEIAVENMTSFYSVILKDFGVECNIVDCYSALYLYKCRHYDEVLQLCERILNEPDWKKPDVKDCLFTYVFVTPPFDSFFDGEVQCLLAFLTIFNHLSPLNDDLHKCDAHVTNDSTFRPIYRHSYYMSEKYNKKCLSCSYSGRVHIFIGTHFLARYLKVRCRIDCNLSYREGLTEFAAQKTYTILETVICIFILRRHHIIMHIVIAKDQLRV